MNWTYTRHAEGQMAERGIARDEMDAMLRQPECTQPDPKRDPAVRLYVGGGVTAVVNEADCTVLTVGIDGASGRDWEGHAQQRKTANQAPPPPRILGNAGARRTRAVRGRRVFGAVQSRHILDGVNPAVRAQVEAVMAGACADVEGSDFRSVQVISPTEVTILYH